MFYYDDIDILVEFEKVEYFIKANKRSKIKELKKSILAKTSVREELQCIVVNNRLLVNDDEIIFNTFANTCKCELILIGKPLQTFLNSHKNSSNSLILKSLYLDQKISYSSEAFDDGSYMIIKEIKKDGSCLYSSIKYGTSQIESDGMDLRKTIRDLLNTEDYQEYLYLIDRPKEEYFKLLLIPSYWGGELEISILSKYFKKRIFVIVLNTLECKRYGDEGYSKVIYLLYTGSHFNLVVRNFLDGDPEMDVTQFRNECSENLIKVLSACENFKLKFEYEELTKFFCDSCGGIFQGKSNSSFHHQETGHNVRSINF